MISEKRLKEKSKRIVQSGEVKESKGIYIGDEGVGAFDLYCRCQVLDRYCVVILTKGNNIVQMTQLHKHISQNIELLRLFIES